MCPSERLPVGFKELEPYGYLGIDFGTSNSHFAYSNTNGMLKADPIKIDGNHSISTCVLWGGPGEKEEDILAIGMMAEQEWCQLSDEDRNGCRFAAGFKPDIVPLERARLDAWAFLRRSYLSIQQQQVLKAIGREEGMPVVIGVPAEISEEHKRLTTELAQRAGFGTVSHLPEPLGALAYHLANNDITFEEVRRGIVVVDFGGGTLDVALVTAKGLREPWGDPLLGGRLFDDLFFQWLGDQNPGVEFQPRDEMFIWQTRCRELKEAFSRHWESGRLKGLAREFKGIVLTPGWQPLVLRQAAVEEFLQRARAYRPSRLAANYFRQLGGPLAALADQEPVDLLARIRSTLLPDHVKKTLSGNFCRLILTGGSSSWPFMKEIAAEVYGVNPKDIICSATPELAVGSGIALYHVLVSNQERTKHFLRSEKPSRKQAFASAVAKRVKGCSEKLGRDISERLAAGVEEIYLTWRNQGGSIRAAEQRINAFCEDFRAPAKAVVEAQQPDLTRDLQRYLRDHVERWIMEHDIRRQVDAHIPAEGAIKVPSPGEVGNVADRVGQGVSTAVTAVVATVAGVLGGNLAGGAGIALIMTGPIGFIIGVAIGIIAVVAGKSMINEAVMNWEWGCLLGVDLGMLQMRITEKYLKEKVQEAKELACVKITHTIEEEMTPLQQQAAEMFDEVLEEIVKDLDILEQVRTVEHAV